MPREREYDRETVLRKALQVFWRNGLAGTSMAQLVRATGLNTASMYQEFGGKEEFYGAALAAAYNTVYVPMLEPMQKQPGLVALKLYLGKMTEYAAGKDYCGCIYLNNLASRNVVPAKVQKKVEALCRHIHALIEGCIVAAQRAGEIPADRDARLLADYVACFVQGLTFYGRLQRHKNHLAAVTGRLIESLRQ